MTGNSAVLFVVFVSPSTGLTSTCTDVFSPNGISGKSVNVHGLGLAGVEQVDRRLLLDRGAGPGIVKSPRSTPPGCHRVFVTPTSKASSVEATIVVSSVSDSCWPDGCATTALERRPVQPGRRATGRGAVDALPDRGHRAGACTDPRSRRTPTPAPATPGRPRPPARPPPARKRSSRRRRSRSSRWPCADSCCARGGGVLRVLRRLERVEEPLHAADAQLERLERSLVRRGPGPARRSTRRA